MNTALYCYFGALGTNFEADIPGHNFYQVPFIDAICKDLNIDNVDFYSYIPENERVAQYDFPEDSLGRFLISKSVERIRNYCPTLDQVFDNIISKSYEYIVLKARFRNLSTLTKKWDDAQQFEDIIQLALRVGYEPHQITILDTDMSMPSHFVHWLEEHKITITTPSIDFNPITKEVAQELKEIHKVDDTDSIYKYRGRALYYGNLNFGNYKQGHSKNPIVVECLNMISEMDHFGLSYDTVIAGKSDIDNDLIRKISRANREQIWTEFSHARICINVSKDLYVQKGFLPARVYESLIFGALPVSYKMPQPHTALSFNNVNEFRQICKFILEMSPLEYYNLYCQVLDNLTNG